MNYFITGLFIFISMLTNLFLAQISEVLLTPIPCVELNISTSKAMFAGTNDDIYVYFYGDFSASGPHNLGYFVEGTHVTKRFNISRVIGNLQYITLHNQGTDGWLPKKLSCILDRYHYELEGISQWVDTFDPNLYNSENDGYEPYAHEFYRGLPFNSDLRLNVTNSYFIQ